MTRKDLILEYVRHCKHTVNVDRVAEDCRTDTVTARLILDELAIEGKILKSEGGISDLIVESDPTYERVES